MLKFKRIWGPASLSSNLETCMYTYLVLVMPILSDIFENYVNLDVAVGGSGRLTRTRDKDY